MKTLHISLTGLLLSIAGIYIFATITENGDTNAILMYYVVFLWPTVVVAVINGIYLLLLNLLAKKTAKILLSLIPIAILAIHSLKKEWTIKWIDGDLVVVTTVTAIALGLTNLIWIISILKTKTR